MSEGEACAARGHLLRLWFDRLTMSGKERRLLGERFMGDIACANAVSDGLLARWGEGGGAG